MLGARLGPYRIEEELGSGGMGAVYRAEVTDRTSVGLERGAKVAVKVIHPHLLATAGFFKRFLREAEIGRRVQHESVVRTYDVDATVVDGRQVNFMVMEYVSGRSLRDVVGELRTVPDALLREIALQSAKGLAAIHAQGIVHRDLKPENILLTDDQRVRIMDLGVARLQEASIAITREGQFAGSVLFAAPEQLTGGEVGPQSDLYSLGVTLLELSTGENPFRRDDAGAVIRAHLQEVPRRANEVNTDTSLFLSEVIATLVAKEPAQRFASAQSLSEVLSEGERSKWWGEREKDLKQTVRHLPRISVRRDTALHGRDAEVGVLRKAWAEVKEGRGRVVLLEGEAGIGKTRLADAFLAEIAADDPHVLYGSYPPSGGLGGISDAILGRFGAGDLESAVRPYLRVTPTLVPAFASLIRHEPPPAGAEPLRGDALHTVICHLMRALAAEKPVLWIVDDLQFATAESRALVLSMARAVPPHRVMLLVTSRTGLPDDELANLSRIEEFRRVPLARLGAREVILLLRESFRSEALAERLGGRIAYKSDGVPYFVFEMIRALKEGRFLEQTADGTVVQTRAISEIEVPSTVRDLIAGRLKDLSESQRAILDAGAVQGISFDPGLVATVIEEKKVRVLRELAEIERRLGIVRGEAGACRFDQSQIQEVLYDELMPDLRSEYHSLLADAYVEREGIGPATASEVQALFVVTHHLRGSRPKAAGPYLEGALGHLDRQHRIEALLELTTRALEARGVVEGEARVATMLRRAGALSSLARHDESLAMIEAAQAAARASGSAAAEIRVRTRLGRELTRRGRYAESERTLQEGITRARELGAPALEANGLLALGYALWPVGRLEDARAAYRTALAIAARIVDPTLEREGTSGLATVLSMLGEHVEERELRERGLELTRASGDRAGESASLSNLAEAHRAFGRYGEALSLYTRALAISREIGHRTFEAIQSINIAETEVVLGDFDGARARTSAALDLAREIDAKMAVCWATRWRAIIALFAGDLVAAEKLAQEAIDLSRSLSNVQTEAESLVTLGASLAGSGHRNESAAALEAAATIAARIGAPDETALAAAYRALVGAMPVAAAVATVQALGEKPWVLNRMRAHFVLWKAGADDSHLAEAQRLLAHLRDNAPESHRESLVANVPLHREIAAATPR